MMLAFFFNSVFPQILLASHILSGLHKSMSTLPLVGYQGLAGYDSRTGIDRLNAFLDTTFRQTEANAFGRDSLRAFFLMPELPGRVRQLNNIVVNLIINEIHPLLIQVLPLTPTTDLEFRNTVIRYEQALLEHRPEQAPSRVLRQSETPNVGTMERYGRGAFFTVDVANTKEGRMQIAQKMIQFAALASKTFAHMALQTLLMGRAMTLNGYFQKNYASQYAYLEDIRNEIDSFCLPNKQQNGLMQLTTLGARVIEHKTGKVATHFILQPVKADALMKNNPVYTHQYLAGNSGPEQFKGPLKVTQSIHGITLLEAPDYVKAQQLSQLSMQERVTVGRQDPVEYSELQGDAKCMPVTYIFDINISDYVPITLAEVFVASGRFKETEPGNGIYVFDIATFQKHLTASQIKNNDHTDQPDPFLEWKGTSNRGSWELLDWLFEDRGGEAHGGDDGSDNEDDDAGGLSGEQNILRGNVNKLSQLVDLAKTQKDIMAKFNERIKNKDILSSEDTTAYDAAKVEYDNLARAFVTTQRDLNALLDQLLESNMITGREQQELVTHIYNDISGRTFDNLPYKHEAAIGVIDKFGKKQQSTRSQSSLPQYARGGKQLRALTVKEWLTLEVPGLNEAGEYKLFGGLLFRPYDTYITDTGIIVRGGSELGLVGHSPDLLEMGKNVANGTQILEYSLFAGGFVADWDLVHVIPNVFYSKILYGGGHRFLDFKTNSQLKSRSFRMNSPDSPCMYGILFPRCKVVSGISTPLVKDHASIMFLKGKCPVVNQLDSRDESYPGSKFCSSYWGWNALPDFNNQRDSPGIAMYLCPGSYKIMHSNGMFTHVAGRTHHGPKEDINSAEIRNKGLSIVQ